MLLCQVGLPAKSGVSGAVLLVVPNVMGVMCWSPPVDRLGNSVRGISFCQVSLNSDFSSIYCGLWSILNKCNTALLHLNSPNFTMRTRRN